ncbi:MAG: methyltransferase domain-containing protein [Gammaproteobacteria bacterium]|nr:methyltransferase domain-containing protein [Gammaproteobacteria bacterium]
MTTRANILAALAVLALNGCGAEPPAAPADALPPRDDTAGPAAFEFDLGDARALLANPNRREGARQRDPLSKPEVILGLLDLQPGQRVIDILGGAGYYVDILSGVVGPQGDVILHNNNQYHGYFRKIVNQQYVENPRPGISYLKSEISDLNLEPESLDAVLLVNSYHDLYNFDPQRGWSKTDVPEFFSQLRAALRPGGKLLVVDHSALPGTGSTAAQALHRIDEEFAQQDVTANGFRLVARSDALRNPQDDRTDIVSDAEFRGKSDRFILLFEKP